MNYSDFILSKTQSEGGNGFSPNWMPSFLFPFQSFLVDFALRKGRAALLEDCGLGKTPQLLVFSENVVRHTNGRVLVLAPLAVSPQIKEQADRFGIETHISRDGSYAQLGPRIILSNYERLHMFNPNDYSGVVCDESSILKNFDGTRRKLITEFLRTVPYRLLSSATAAPNDYTELGTSSEALGHLGHMDMLSRFFKNAQQTIRPMVYRNKGQNVTELENAVKWRFKGHAEGEFWKWVSSWARAIRKPSDIGFSDEGYTLPELIERSHVVKLPSEVTGTLFEMPAFGLHEQREERRRSTTQRAERLAELCAAHPSSVAWCHLNPEGDLLENLIPGSVQVSGRDSDDAKEEKLTAFSKGQITHLVTKASIAGWGLNWQHCAHSGMFPSHSFEQYYQSIRRLWRFGQKRSVLVDIVTTEGESTVLANLQRKQIKTEKMFASLVQHMNESIAIERPRSTPTKIEVPSWM